MGLMNRLFKTIRFPSFPVCIYGKLPCHKEYLRAGTDPLFAEFERRLDQGFERRISDLEPPPHVLPDRRFYLYGDGSNDLVGCVFESNDGQRHFPFMMAASLPARLLRKPFPIAVQILGRLWDYFEAYYLDLRGRNDANAVYAAVRGVVHSPEAFVPQETETPSETAPEPDANGLCSWTIRRNDLSPTRLPLEKLPRWLLLPASSWPGQIDGETVAWWGKRGLADIETAQFRQDVTGSAGSLVPRMIHRDEPEHDSPNLEDTAVDDPGELGERDRDEPPMFAPPLPLGKPDPEES